MLLRRQQHLQPDLVSVSGRADIDPPRYGAVAEERVDLGVGEVQELTDSVSDIK